MLNFRIVLDPSVISSLSWERFSVMSAAAVDMYLLGKLVMDLLVTSKYTPICHTTCSNICK